MRVLERIRTKKQMNLAIQLFKENRTDSYISHGEIESGRADNFNQWSASLTNKLLQEFTLLLDNRKNKFGKQAYFWIKRDAVVGLSILNINRKLSIIEDLIIAKEHRGNGIGTMFVEALHKKLNSLGCSVIILEIGIKNKSSQKFFSSLGYAPASITMCKES